MLNFCVAARVLISYASCFILNPRHGAFELATCARKGCKRVALHGVFCTSHTHGCIEAGCGDAATSGTYYCQRHYVKPPPRKTVVIGGKSKGKGITRPRKIKKAKAEESDDDEDYDPSEEEYCRPVKKQKASPRKHRYGTRGIRVPPPPPSPPTSEDEEEEEEEMPALPSPEKAPSSTAAPGSIGSKGIATSPAVAGSNEHGRINMSPIPGIMSSPIRVPYSNRRWGFGNGPQGAETPSAMRQLMNPDPAHLVSGGTPGGADPHHFDFLCDYEDPLLFGSPAPALSG